MCPRSPCLSRAVLNEPQVVEQLVGSAEPYCLLPFSSSGLLSSSLPFLFLVVVVKVFSQNRVQQRFPSSGKRISERTVEQIVDISPVVALVRGLLHLLVLQMRILLGFFALFPRGKKVRHDLRTPGSVLPPHSSPWTPPAYDVSYGPCGGATRLW